MNILRRVKNWFQGETWSVTPIENTNFVEAVNSSGKKETWELTPTYRLVSAPTSSDTMAPIKRKRGRPRKNV